MGWPASFFHRLGLVHAAQVGDGHRNGRRLSRIQVHLGPDVAPVTPGVARLPAQNEYVAGPARVQHPLAHLHGKLAHELPLSVGLAAVQDQPEVGGPAVEPDRFVLPGNPALVEVCRPPGLQLAAGDGPGLPSSQDGIGQLGVEVSGQRVGVAGRLPASHLAGQELRFPLR